MNEITSREDTEIPVKSYKRKFVKGKEIRALGKQKNIYEIILFLKNTGEHIIESKTIHDIVPPKFEAFNFSMEPQVTDLNGDYIVSWTMKNIQPGETREISFIIEGTTESRASSAQLGF